MVSPKATSHKGDPDGSPFMWVRTIGTVLSIAAGIVVLLPHLTRLVQTYPGAAAIALLCSLLGNTVIAIRQGRM
jgi:hypothetical protein